MSGAGGAGSARRFTLDGSVRRVDGGRVLLGGSPLRLFKLTVAGARLVDRIERGEPVAPSVLVDRLLDAGALHPATPAILSRRIAGDSPGDASPQVDVTVVVPAYGRAPSADLLGRLRSIGPVLVVDDGSSPPLVVPERPGLRVVRHPANRGPGAARTTGLAEVDTPFVLFVDDDVDLPDPGSDGDPAPWLAPLLAHLDADPTLAAIAPRVVARRIAGDSPGEVFAQLNAYEQSHGPLDLGPVGGRVSPRTRISYVPSAVLLARTDAIRAVGGFAADLRTGEDVDLIWRLVAAGHRVRYEPAVTVGHATRPTLAAWLRQRAGYGRSAAPLADRHPGTLAPVGVSAWSAAAWVLAALGFPRTGLAVAAGSTAALPRKLTALADPWPEALRLAGLGHLHAGRQLARAVTRVWWPVALVAALVSTRARRAVLAAAVLPALSDWVRHRPAGGLGPARYTALRLLDDASYGWGVWQGVLATRNVEPLVPDLSSWPGRSRAANAQDASAS